MAVGRLARHAGEIVTVRPHPDLLVLSHRRTSPQRADMYDLSVCLVVQGRKETTTSSRTYGFEDGPLLIVSHDVPVDSRITRATREHPYVALILTLDRHVLADLHDHAGDGKSDADDDLGALRVGRADHRLIGAFARYLAIADSTQDTAVLGPMIVRELHYLLLTAAEGLMLRRLVRHEGHAASIERAIRSIRADIARPIVVPDLARDVGLSPSALHKHFKAITGTSPIQYVKRLRLLEARRMLVTEQATVAASAHAVGYASSTQFSREYAREFGLAPSLDRDAGNAAAE